MMSNNIAGKVVVITVDVNEILFRAGIRPGRRAGVLRREDGRYVAGEGG